MQRQQLFNGRILLCVCLFISCLTAFPQSENIKMNVPLGVYYERYMQSVVSGSSPQDTVFASMNTYYPKFIVRQAYIGTHSENGRMVTYDEVHYSCKWTFHENGTFSYEVTSTPTIYVSGGLGGGTQTYKGGNGHTYTRSLHTLIQYFVDLAGSVKQNGTWKLSAKGLSLTFLTQPQISVKATPNTECPNCSDMGDYIRIQREQILNDAKSNPELAEFKQKFREALVAGFGHQTGVFTAYISDSTMLLRNDGDDIYLVRNDEIASQNNWRQIESYTDVSGYYTFYGSPENELVMYGLFENWSPVENIYIKAPNGVMLFYGDYRGHDVTPSRVYPNIHVNDDHYEGVFDNNRNILDGWAFVTEEDGVQYAHKVKNGVSVMKLTSKEYYENIEDFR